MKLRIYTDGGARGNPGPAASAAVIKEVYKSGAEGNTIASVSRYLGIATNNQAEYTAVVIALEKAKDLKAETIEFYMDSELAVMQLNGEYRVKNQELARLYLRIFELSHGIKKVSYRHIRREQNAEADKLVNKCIDENL